MPSLLSLLRRCIYSSVFDIHFSPDRFKFLCPSLNLYLFITFRKSSFEIDYNNGLIYIEYNVPEPLSNKYLLTYDISCTDNECFKHAEIFYNLYSDLLKQYVYPTLSSIKPSRIHVKECSEYLIESNVGKLVSYPYLDFFVYDALHFRVITSMFNEFKKFDCIHPRRYITRFVKYAKKI